jgi:MFS family permease
MILTLPGLTIALGAPLAGYWADRAGRIRVLILGALAYTFAGAAPYVLEGVTAILLSRAILGFSVSCVMTAGSTLIGDYFEGADRNRVLGLQAAAMSFAGVVFVLASTGISLLGWRECFFLYGAGLLLLPMVFAFLYEPHRHRHEDSHGVPGESAPANWPVVTLTCAGSFYGMLCFNLIPVQLPFLVDAVHGDHTALGGVAVAASSFLGAAAASQYHRLRARLGLWAIAALVFALMGSGYTLIAHAREELRIFFAVIPGGIGMGIMMPNFALWTLSVTPERLRGRIVGALTACVFLGQFASPILADPLVRRGGIALAFSAAGGSLFAVAAMFAVVAVFKRGARAAAPESAE